MGAALDLAADADLHIELCSRLDTLNSHMMALRELQRRPLAVRMPSVALVGAAGVVAGNGGGPPGGFTWQVRRTSFGPARGQETAITTAGTLIVYVDNEEIIRTSTVPNMIPWSHAQLTVRYPSKITYEWVGGTAGVTLIVGGQAVQQPSSIDYQA